MEIAIQSALLPALHRAAHEGDIAELKRLLSAGADPNEPVLVPDPLKDEFEGPPPDCLATPLMFAAAGPHDAEAAIRTLVEAGANPALTTNREETALWFALYAGNSRALELLLEAGCPPDEPRFSGQSVLAHAASAGSAEFVRVLLEKGASPHALLDPAYSFAIPLFTAAESGDAECVRLLLAAGAKPGALDMSDATALMHAASREAVAALIAGGCPLHARDSYHKDAMEHALENGHREVLFALVEAGLDVEARGPSGITPLIEACFADEPRAEMVRALIHAGAQVDDVWYDGYRAIHVAAELWNGSRNGKLREIILALAEGGADVNCRDDNGRTPLHYAVGQEGIDLGAIKTLVELGAEVNAVDSDGRTPLMDAASGAFRAVEAVPLLIKLGANPHLRCKKGWTALDYAKEHRGIWRKIVKDPQFSQHQTRHEQAYEEAREVFRILGGAD